MTQVQLTPNDDFEIRNTTDDSEDIITEELTEDPSEMLGVDPKELANELNKYDFENGRKGNDDRREEMEDLDEDGESQDE